VVTPVRKRQHTEQDTPRMTDTIQITMPRALAVKFFDLFGTQLGEEVSSTLSKAVSKGGEKAAKATAKADKKPRANAGQSTAHGDYTKQVLKSYPKDSAEFKAFLAKRVAAAEAGQMAYTADQAKVKSGKKAVGDLMDAKEAVSGAHIPFVAEWKKEHQAEWLTFKAQWDQEHPKGSRAASVADGASEAGSAEGADEPEKPKRSGRPKLTEEQKQANKAKRDAKKAAAAAASPDAPAAPAEDEAEEGEAVDLSEEQSVAAPAEAAEEEVEDDLLPFSKGGVDYLRWGHLDADGDEVWHPEGYTWLKNADGSKGAFAGKMVGTKLDKSAEAMADEPEFE